MMELCHLGVMAKFWEPGKVKTRLAASIGPVAASRWYRRFLVETLRRFADVGDRRTLLFSPENRRREFADLAGARWSLRPQGDGDLGERMRRFFEAETAHPAMRAVLIGSDSPTLPVAYVEQAFERLSTHPVVLGPATDGGYYLVGATGAVPPLFDSIDWSTPEVWSQTTERLDRYGIGYAALPPWHDIDTADDLKRIGPEIGRGEPQD